MKMPYTEALLKSIPKLENPSHTKLQIIGGRPPDLVNPPKGCRFAPRCPYVREKCLVEEPPLVEAETPGHVYACWYPVGSPEYHETGARVAGPRATPRRGERGQLMAGSGDAHLRPDGEALLRVEDLVVEFPVGRTGLQGERGVGHHLRRAARRDARPRGRVGLRQVDDRPGHHAAAPPTGGSIRFDGQELTAAEGRGHARSCARTCR